jgi:UPF0176 protein
MWEWPCARDQKKATPSMPLYNIVNREELKRRMRESDEPRVTLSFYRYHHIADPRAFRDELYRRWQPFGILGRVYIAAEGINAQISMPEDQFDAFNADLYAIDWLEDVRLNIAIDDDGRSFFLLAIKVREKIVADGLDDDSFDVTRRGKHLSAAEVNDLIERGDAIVVDMRNHYESEVGHFKGALCPKVQTFREALPVVEELLRDKKEEPIIMYCTGGIRCEKASAYYLHRGFREVFMIDGGIIEYTRQCREQGLPNKFVGKNFVFDERLGERISDEVVALCHQCGSPSDAHTNCANDDCHLLFIQCPACGAAYQGCCSSKCAEYRALSSEERAALKGKIEFNGSRFGKGRYRAFREDERLVLE